MQLLLQQRNPSTLKCYSDVLNEKHDRAFKGTVIVLLSLEPSGGQSKAADVKVIGGTMTDKEVTSCVVEKLKDFDYPEISAEGHDAVRLPLRTGVLIRHAMRSPSRPARGPEVPPSRSSPRQSASQMFPTWSGISKGTLHVARGATLSLTVAQQEHLK